MAGNGDNAMSRARTSAEPPKPREPRLCTGCWPAHMTEHYTVTSATTVECELVTAKREALDAKLVCEMNEMRGLPTKCNTRPELKAWEL